MPVIDVTTPGGSYPVIVERGVVSRFRDYLPQEERSVFIVTEKQVWNAVGDSFPPLVEHVVYLPGGEANKRLQPLEALAERVVELGGDRSSIVVAVGGGIVSDMAGFFAAIFMRGIPVIQIPTTLLGQVDASVGGKTGVNLAGGKNLIGSFHQPQTVLIDPGLLSTLPEREYRAGLFEVIKYGVIDSPELFTFLQENRAAVLGRDPDVLDSMIATCVRIKARVVSADERESGLRAILNFGHTVGHAIEAETNYNRYLHGEAVALGMQAAAQLAHSCSGLDRAELSSILGVISDYGPVPPASDLSPARLFKRLAQDKKTRKGHIHFVLPTAIGKVQVQQDLPEEAVIAAIEKGLA